MCDDRDIHATLLQHASILYEYRNDIRNWIRLSFLSGGRKPAVSYEAAYHDVIGDVRFISPQATYHIDKDKTSCEVSTVMWHKGTNFDVSGVTIWGLVCMQVSGTLCLSCSVPEGIGQSL